MPRLSKSLPKYSKHRASGQAVVTLCGRDHYLGPYGTRASKLEYDRLIAEWLANGRSASPAGNDDLATQLTVVELIARFVNHLQETYPNAAAKGSEPSRIRPVLKIVKSVYGRTSVADFGPLSLKAVRQKFIDAGQCRSFVNENTRRVVRMFRWGVAEELVHPDILRALEAVEGLRKGRTSVREGRTVQPVPAADVQATLPHLPPVLADVVRLQLLTGARPSEILNMKPGQIARNQSDCWEYVPPHHKNSHRDQSRKIYLGPQAIEILRPYLLRPADSFCFSPSESESKRRRDRHAKRVTPLHYGNRPGTNKRSKPVRPPGECYTKDSYRRAVERAAKSAKVPRWFPYQLRHSRATDLREKFGIEGVQCVLGHTELRTSELYAQRSEIRAREIAREVG